MFEGGRQAQPLELALRTFLEPAIEAGIDASLDRIKGFLAPTIDTACMFEELDPEQLISEVERQTCRTARAASLDLDGTVIPHTADKPSEKSIAVISRFVELLPEGVVFNTSAGSEVRVQRAHNIVAGLNDRLGILYPDKKKILLVTTLALGGLVWQRKPFKSSFNAAASKVGVPPDALFHVGDQVLKDSLGAKNARFLASVHVDTCSPGEDPPYIQALRGFERTILRAGREAQALEADKDVDASQEFRLPA
jgi:predicted HAD superfamily phosphohydrolase YqeG